jgi:hypothetical protein
MRTITRKSLLWAAPVALVAATGLAACGDSSDDTNTRALAPAAAAAGSDVHLGNLADDIASRVNTSYGSDVHLGNLADDIASQVDEPDSSGEFVAGSGRMPSR